MSGKNEFGSQKKLTPGPGAYEDINKCTNYYKTLPGSKMGADSRQSTFLKASTADKPAPGMYELPCFTANSQAPRFGFGSSVRDKDYSKSKKKLAFPPGPGRYEAKTVLGH